MPGVTTPASPSATTNATGVSSPYGGTFLDSMKRNFTDVPIYTARDNAVSTTEFLEAAETIPALLDLIGGYALTPVKADILVNIKRIRERQLVTPTLSATLQDLVRNELKDKKRNGSEGLLWLVRGLDFTRTAIAKNIATPSEEPVVSFRHAYNITLKQYHNFLVQPIVTAALAVLPYRNDLYVKLGVDYETVAAALKIWLCAMEKVLAILISFLHKEAKW